MQLLPAEFVVQGVDPLLLNKHVYTLQLNLERLRRRVARLTFLVWVLSVSALPATVLITLAIARLVWHLRP